MSESAILTEGLTKQYRRWIGGKTKPALSNLNLDVPRGIVFGFLGHNGAGKTTTIRCLMDLIRPTGGKAYVLGEPIGQVRIRAKIGYLPDNPAFSPHLTANQFLNLCSKLLRIPTESRGQRIGDVLKEVSMVEHARRPLKEFSRGMIQRIGIAQALLNDPELLILDEPLVGLDPHGRKDLLDIVRRRKEMGTCIFFCSHILSDVEKLCDQVGILSQGELKMAGPLAELLTATGLDVCIPPSQEELAKELMMKADGSTHNDTDGWVLSFKKEENIKELRARELPSGVSLKDQKESLEDLFFRLTKKENAE